MIIIGISGKKRSGKDTVADILTSIHRDCVRYYFAQQLKVEVALGCGVTVDYINNHKNNFRLILQGWGTDFRRRLYGDDYWIKKMEMAVQQLSSHNILLIPDVRFKNEFDFIKSYGGITMRVERGVDTGDQHVSETELDGQTFDFHINNNGSIEELVEKVKQIKL